MNNELTVVWNQYKANLWAQVVQDGERFVINVTDSTIAHHPSLFAREFATLTDAINAGQNYLSTI